jgi:MFS transporter, SET family, sugar efflux transporter
VTRGSSNAKGSLVTDTRSTSSPTSTSSLQVVARSPLYRGATVSLFISGLGMSAAAPQIALFLVNELHASLTVAGLFYLTNLTAPVAGYLVGARSDRTGNRLACSGCVRSRGSRGGR